MGGISKNDLIIKYQKEFISQFKDKDFVTALAPGRINIIGEHTDYNLGFAIPIAIDRWICSVISIREDREINICASNFKDHISLDIDNLNINKVGWQKYVLGCVEIFLKEYNINKGFNILIGGNVPIGFGMSSSAALEVSLLGALFDAFKIPIDNYKILELSNRVERESLGIQSGLLDQYASIFSKKSQPLLIDFSTLSHTYTSANIKGASWVLVNSMVDRSLVDSKYNDRVEECQLGLDYINNLNNEKIKINELTYSHLKDLENYNDNKILYKRISHILSENKRVLSMQSALNIGDLQLIGDILNQSHNSLANNYQVSCKEIDEIISISQDSKGFYGGRIMGGGFGGCTLNLVDNYYKTSFIENLVDMFYKKFQYELKIECVQFSNGFELV